MKEENELLKEQLRHLSRQVAVAPWASGLSAGLLLLMLLFPKAAESITSESLRLQEFIGPFLGGMLATIIGLVAVVLCAAYIVSKVSRAELPPSGRRRSTTD
ncbi:MAG: hypothetical protein SFU53_09970 [Terrimicrobiaceae bacterium]|nr:hypothetical protein [Terrimicrobiaceae bacterium]